MKNKTSKFLWYEGIITEVLDLNKEYKTTIKNTFKIKIQNIEKTCVYWKRISKNIEVGDKIAINAIELKNGILLLDSTVLYK